MPERLRVAREIIGCETLNYEEVSVLEALKEMTGGRGPDACIEAVGMEAHARTPDFALDKAKQTLRLGTDSGHALREAIFACRKGGTLAVLGVYGPAIDTFPMGALMNKCITLKSAQVYAHKYIPRLLEHTLRGELDSSFLMTHRARLEEAPDAYAMWRNKENGCLRVVFEPGRR
ncbi:Sorbitol dehydrogenase [compost metagenome]